MSTHEADLKSVTDGTRRRSDSDRRRLPSDAFDQLRRLVAHPGFAKAGGRAQSVVMTLVVEWCDRNAECWPSVETIAEKVGCDRGGVSSALTQLERVEVISFPKGRKGGRVKSGRTRTSLIRVDAALPSNHGEIATVPNHGENATPAMAKTPRQAMAKTPRQAMAKTPHEQYEGEQYEGEQDRTPLAPRKRGEREARRSARQQRKAERAERVRPYIEALERAIEGPLATTTTERERHEADMEKLLHELSEVREPLTPQQIYAAARAAELKWSYETTVTPRALLNNWTMIEIDLKERRDYNSETYGFFDDCQAAA